MHRADQLCAPWAYGHFGTVLVPKCPADNSRHNTGIFNPLKGPICTLSTKKKKIFSQRVVQEWNKLSQDVADIRL